MLPITVSFDSGGKIVRIMVGLVMSSGLRSSKSEATNIIRKKYQFTHTIVNDVFSFQICMFSDNSSLKNRIEVVVYIFVLAGFFAYLWYPLKRKIDFYSRAKIRKQHELQSSPRDFGK